MGQKVSLENFHDQLSPVVPLCNEKKKTASSKLIKDVDPVHEQKNTCETKKNNVLNVSLVLNQNSIVRENLQSDRNHTTTSLQTLDKPSKEEALSKPCLEVIPNETESRSVRLERCLKLCSEITEFLFISGEEVSKNRFLLQSVGITHILNCSSGSIPNYFEKDGYFDYLSFNLLDGTMEDVSPFLLIAIDWIEKIRQKSGKLLVHCHQGVSRSCTLVIAYLMWWKNLTYDLAFAYVRQHRGICSPNSAFICQLLEWQSRLAQVHSPLGKLYYVAPHATYDSSLIVRECFLPGTRTSCRFHVEHLDPRGCFLVLNKSTVYIWIGRKCNDPNLSQVAEEFSRLVLIYEYVNPEVPIHVKMVQEGEETSDFLQIFLHEDQKMYIEERERYNHDFSQLHNKMKDSELAMTSKNEYPNNSSLRQSDPVSCIMSHNKNNNKDHSLPPSSYINNEIQVVVDEKPQLYRLWINQDNPLKKWESERYYEYDSEELISTDVFLLVCSTITYLWIGNDTSSFTNNYLREVGQQHMENSDRLQELLVYIQSNQLAPSSALPKLNLEFEGKESESFWIAFELGY